MPTLTDVRQEITKALESPQVSKPLYAVAGVGDLAIEKLRDAEKRVRALHLDQRIAGLGEGARTLPSRVQHVQADVQGKVRDLPSSVVDAALAASGRAGGVYEDLSVRGKKLVDGFAGQRAVSVTDAPKRKPTTAAGNGSTAKAKSTSTAAKKPAAKKPAAKKTTAKKTTNTAAKKS